MGFLNKIQATKYSGRRFSQTQGGDNLDKRDFRAEVKKQLYLQGMKYKELAEKTGYTYKTMQMMMCDDTRLSDKAMTRISEVLGIKN